MLYPLKVVDLELSRPLETLENLEGYLGVQGLVRLHGAPIGYIQAPIANGCCTAEILGKCLLEQQSWGILQRLLQNGLATSPNPEGIRLKDLYDLQVPECDGELPLVTIAVCTRDRTADLALCLDSLCQLDYPHLDLLVVDNAPSTEATQELLQAHYPQIRYVCEPRPGLDWARNRAIIEAKGEILAYTDDDVVVDRGWVKALAKAFVENPEVMAITGLVVPYELETEAQVLFEWNGGFGRGFDRKWYRVYPDSKMPWGWLGAGQFGTGANMAYRRCIFEEIGPFDPALDVGTPTNGGGDLEMFFRVLKKGHTLLYEPDALVRHRHRRDYEKLHSQLTNNGIGLYSYFVCGATTYPEERRSFIWLGIWWLCYWSLRRLWIAFKHPTQFPLELVKAEFWGSFIGITRYQKAQKQAAEIIASFGPQEAIAKEKIAPEPPAQPPVEVNRPVAVRSVELTQPLHSLVDVTQYSDVQVFVTWRGEPLGGVSIPNIYQPIHRSRLSQAIIEALGLKAIQPLAKSGKNTVWAEAFASMTERYSPNREVKEVIQCEKLPDSVSVSINLATYDRPDDLRNCLQCLVKQQTARRVEIIVVDNHPASGLTAPVVAEFPEVKLVKEPRQGLAYARNAGFVASTGDIVIATDDDVTLPPDWIEKLVAPFARPDVMIVTGNVLPLQLETIYQRFFERYGGLGRGFEPFEVNGDWFKSFPKFAVPTWGLGATANAAFRASIFTHPQIGLMQEALGPGMPSGVGEDTYLFYKVLKAGYTITYEPSAYVWHKHRRDLSALRRQIFGYSKGHVSYNLTTWLRDGDWRGFLQVFVALPMYHTKRILTWLRGTSDYPLSLILLEIQGNILGPWVLWRSHQRVKLEGRSAPYIPVAERPQTAIAPSLEATPIQVGMDAHGS
ncbi:glycosyltransferase [Oscillatoria sp. FACHB-1406]|uniref:glycosyltransferase family 2 protein n=1 Tax=Oscillatoria sp. FACHB-1406 TaxID=2692846 RepID=UPI001685C081|nr:glycosyltransferase [Oscillatoria sp. FACHB-1406]MBD2578574.1 glycosyltransferase [Oscillatoria sp. FACHB-1406]